MPGAGLVPRIVLRRRSKGTVVAKPMFFFTAIYKDEADAEADYEAIKRLHDEDAIGSYDSAIIVHQANGEVRVTKTEKPTEHGAWVGLAAGAGTAVLFPFLLPAFTVAGMAAAGAGVGAWFGHLAHGTSRREAKEIGNALSADNCALVVIGIDKDAERIEEVTRRATKRVLKRDVGDWDDAERDAMEAIERIKQPA
jgi:uncharacterized membrane protein